MAWQKLGHVFTANHHATWMQGYASTPFAAPLNNTTIRCYFSTRDPQNRSHIASLDINPRQPADIANLTPQPILSPGPQGAFDDSGVSMMQIVEHAGRRYLYYLGWNLGVTTPFRNSVGLAIADAGSDCFTKISEAPILDRGHHDPLSISSPWVLAGNEGWKMWYGSHTSWQTEQSDMHYVIKLATSPDGIHWHRDGHIALNTLPGETAVVRPSVIHENGEYHMWYSRRIGNKQTCAMGYAHSPDGRHWQRRDDAVNLTVRPSGWDSEMLCYPCVFDHAGSRYMLYNGNGFGRTGFGLALWQPQ